MEANSKLFSKILLYHYSFFQCYMGNKSGSDLNFAKWETHGFWWWWLGTNWHIRAALQPCVRFLLCSTFVKKKRKSRLNGNIMIIITNFPCFFCVQQEVGNKDSSGPGACYAMLCCVHFMKKTWVSSPPFTAYLHAKLDQTISALMMKFTKKRSISPSLFHPKVVHKCNRSTPPPFSLWLG